MPLVPAWTVPLTFFLAAVGAASLIWLMLRDGLARRMANDVPNHRSLHAAPIPRVGGLALVPCAALGMSIAAPAMLPVALIAVVLAAISFVDDRGGLSAGLRFVFHFAAALALIWLYPVPLPWWLSGVVLIGLVWLINLYNFMDGSDGLAGGMAVIGFGCYAVAAFAQGRLGLSGASAAVAGAAAGFLLFNIHPARIFLGDAGSIPLGFLAGAIGYFGWRDAVWSPVFVLLVFAPFIADASVTLLRRLSRGARVWEAHREHLYQRMVIRGWSHARTARLWYLAMVVAAFSALATREADLSIQLLVLGMALGAYVAIDLMFSVRQERPGAD